MIGKRLTFTCGVPVQVNATDSESSGTAGLITYSITDGARGMFSIDGTTGRISKLGELDRENVSVYVLTVQAEDTGNVAFTSFAQVMLWKRNSQDCTMDNSVYCTIYDCMQGWGRVNG